MDKEQQGKGSRKMGTLGSPPEASRGPLYFGDHKYDKRPQQFGRVGSGTRARITPPTELPESGKSAAEDPR